MRTEKELLELLRDEIKNNSYLWKTEGCMCYLIDALNSHNYISNFEYTILIDYLFDHLPKGKTKDSIWYASYDATPRVHYLNNEISKL